MIDSFHRNYNYNNILVQASAGRKKDEIYFSPVAARRTKDWGVCKKIFARKSLRKRVKCT
jgi:hypothetical protein